jgi:heme exporter protein D
MTMEFYFADFQAFWAMGKHGPFVWSCYLMVVLVLVWLAVSPSLKLRRLKKLNAARLRTGAKPISISEVS